MSSEAASLLGWVVNALLGVVAGLLYARIRHIEEEVKLLRERLHDARSKLVGLEALAKSKGWF